MGFDALLVRMQELKDLAGLVALATWDEQTYLPPLGSPGRGHQLAALSAVLHERLVDPALGDLLESAASLPSDELPGAMVRVLSRDRRRALNVPPDLVRALAQAQSRGLAAWHAARHARSFALFAPALKELLDLRREQANAIGHQGEPYDALLDGYEPGMTVARLDPVLTRLKERLVPMVQALAAARPPPDVLAGRRFDAAGQWRFARLLLEQMGFQFDAGRLDPSIHPFSCASHPRDVRLTTRVDETQLWPAVFATLHEGGHGLYAQGLPEALHRTPLATAPSAGLDESQSRLWENGLGKSRHFWTYFFPRLQQHLPQSLGDITEEGFYGAIHRVTPGSARGGADEVTYNLHIILRYELERLLMRDALPLEDLPREWNRRTHQLLGVTPPDDNAGVLQDIHWSAGDLGYFPTYALGNLYAASLLRALRQGVTDLDARLAQGELSGATQWLRENVYVHGARYDAEELVRRVCGHGLRDDDFLVQLADKYGELYGVSLAPARA